MIYKRQFIKELSITAIGIFVILLVVLIATQAINLLGRAASGRVAIDAVVALVGFWTIGLTPVLLILTAYISSLTVLTRYWKDSEMAVWLSSGLSLKNWVQPILQFTIPFAILVGVVSMLMQPWAEYKSREFAEILKQKQELSLIEPGVFKEIGKNQPRVYFIESFNEDTGIAKNLFIREKDKNQNDVVIFALSGYFKQDGEKRVLELRDGYRYSGTPGHANYERASFKDMMLVISASTTIIDPKESRRTTSTLDLWNSNNPSFKSELLWRISLPLSVIILTLLSLPLSYFNPRSGRTYNLLFAIAIFLIYQNGLTFMRDAVESGQLSFWVGLLPMHIMMFLLFLLLMKIRNEPGEAIWPALKSILRIKAK